LASKLAILARWNNFTNNLSKEYIERFATKEAMDAGDEDSASDSSMSEVGSYDSEEEDPAAHMEV
jgi:hypothetical protein